MTPEFSPKPRSLAWPSRFAISLLILSACSTLVAQSVFFERVDIVTGLPLAGNVLTGDFNNDGKPDIILDTLTSSEGASVFLLLGNGDGTFSPPTRLWGWLGAPKAADVNADGKLDLVFTDGSNIWVTLGKGDGTFGDYIKSPLTAGAGGRHLVVDLNRDGKPDVVLVLQDGGLALALGNGDGTFGSFTTYPLSGGGVAGYVAAADFRGAGKMDLGATNEGTPPYYRGATVSVLSGNGDGTFGPATDFTAGEGAFRLVTGDFNGDGKIDLGVGNYHSASVSVLLGNGDGTFLPKTDFYVGEFPVALGSADFNGDGKLDFAVGGAPLALSILSGNGDGSFAVKQDFPSANSIKSLEVADFNLDGKPDVAVIPHGSSGTLSIFLNTTGAESAHVTATMLTASTYFSGYGQSVTFTATVTSNSGMPIGTVQILNGSTVLGRGTLANRTVSIPVATLPAGIDSITAFYIGGGGFAPSKSSPLTQTVTKAATAPSLASSVNPAGTNQGMTFRAVVSSQYGGAVTGTVTFMAGAQMLGSVPLSGNVASLTTSFANAGTYSITARYNGDSDNTGSTSSALSEKILAATTTTLISSLNPSAIGQAVTFKATVTSSAGIPRSGEPITFYNGTAVLGTAPLSAGAAMLTTSALPAGVFTMTARYPGDSAFLASTSTGLRQTVNATSRSATATTVASSLNPSIYGQKVTLIAQVTSLGPIPPTGTVVFMWKYFTTTYTIGTAALNSAGVATLTKSNLNASLFPMIAVYRGDINNLSSTSPVLNQTVLQTTTKATITSSLNPSTVGQAVTFTAKIASPTVMPTGPVTFSLASTTLGTAQLSGGKATFMTSSLLAGSNVVKVTYLGNSNISKSSAVLTQVVHQ